MKITISILILFLSTLSFGQSSLKDIELRTISLKNYEELKLKKTLLDGESMVTNEKGESFFLLLEKEELFYYTNRKPMDNDIVNNIIPNIYYMLNDEIGQSNLGVESYQVDYANKTLIRK